MAFDDRTSQAGNAAVDLKPSQSGCAEWGHAISLYVDGELGEAERTGFETHLETCEGCRDAADYGRAFHASLRRGDVRAPVQLRAGVLRALDQEAPAGRSPISFLRRLWAPMPVAAAGATALGLTALFWQGGSADDVVRELVARHSRPHLPLELQSSDPRMIEAWLQDKVDFHMTVPRPANLPLSLMGARLWNVRDHAAVYLVYSTPQSPTHRVSMLVYGDPSGRMPSVGTPRRIDDHEVYMANRAGFDVAIWKKDEVVYSLVTDSADDVPSMVHAVDQN